MFVGHYGVSFAARRAAPGLPLWALFLAVQLLDVGWGILVPLGVEHVRIVPGITATNPLDLYYMPYTHSLVAALIWSAAAGGLGRVLWPGAGRRGALVLAGAVFSHWVLDLLVHRPDLPLWGDSMKVGFGLWNHALPAFGLEVAFLFGGIAVYLTTRPPRPIATIIVGLIMLFIHTAVFFGAPPESPDMAAVTALMAYGFFAAIAWYLERPKPGGGPKY